MPGNARRAGPCSFFFSNGLKGKQDALDLFLDMRFFAVEVLEFLGFIAGPGQFLLKLGDALRQVPVLGNEGLHPLFHLNEFIFQVRHGAFTSSGPAGGAAGPSCRAVNRGVFWTVLP